MPRKRQSDRRPRADAPLGRDVDTLTRITALAALALGDPEDLASARAWLARPNRALGGTPPISLLDTDEGVEIVERAIARRGRAEHGVYD